MVYIREQPDPAFASLPHGRYDIVTKDALQKFPEDILQAVLERADFKFIEFVEGEFTTVEIRRTDSLIKVLLGTGLMPFVPLMQPPVGMERLQWAIQCNESTKTLTLPTDIRSNLLVSQWVMSGLIHPHQAISGFLSEAVMQESSVYEHLLETTGEERYQQGIQQGIQQGTEQGARQTAIKSLFEVLEFRFDGRAVQVLKPALEKIQDLQRLEQLHREALRAENFEAFARILAMNGNR